MILLRQWPEVASLSCTVCQKLQIDEKWQIVKQAGQPVPRAPSTFPPCRYPHIGCPKGTPENSNALTPANELVYQYHKECEAVGQWPDDALVKRNAAIIRAAEDAVDRERADRVVDLLSVFLGVAK